MSRFKVLSLKPIVGAGLLIAIFSGKVMAQAPTISYSSGSYTYTVGSQLQTLTPTVTGSPTINGQTITLAGNGGAGHTDGTGTGAAFNHPAGLAHDAAGNVYVGDAWNNCIRKITPAGIVTTLAGSGTAGYADGSAATAQFNLPYGVAVDLSGNVYVADYNNNRIRVISPAGMVSTLAGNSTAGYADGTGTAASFNHPSGVAVDAAGNVYVADSQNNMIRKITPAGVVTTLAGSTTAGSVDGTGTAARFNRPFSLTVDPWGNIFVADWYNFTIRKISPNAAVITFAGSTTSGSTDGTGTAASFYYPAAITSDGSGNLYVADEYNNKVRKITQAAVVTTLSGSGTQGAGNGIGTAATFYQPLAITCDATGYVYVAEYGNCLVRKAAMAPFSINGTLQQGLNFNAASGTFSGRPAALTTAASYTVTAYNYSGTGTAGISLTVNASPKSPTLTSNYVMTQTPRISGIMNDSTMAANNTISTSVQTNIQYVDGLGRPIQTVQAGASPQGYDIIAPQAYDQYGREVTKYLPYTPQTGTAGSYRPNAISTDQGAFYTTPPSGSGVTAITDPYAQTAFDNSPLNRAVEQGAPGVPWQLTGVSGGGHTVKMVYTLNNATGFSTDSVNGRQAAMYYVTIGSDSVTRTLHANGYYPASTLTVTVGKDENWVSGRNGTVEEYKDIDGQVVLKRQYNYAGGALQMLSTYYVYDDLGHLAFVLPPASGADAAGTIGQTTLNNLCYQYQYDGLGRPIAKKIPGKGWEYVVYNVMDQPVATQDSLQRANSQWLFTKYDALQRPIWTGIWNNGGAAVSRASLQGTLNGIRTNLYEATSTSGNGYTNVAWPTSSVTATLTLDYYDGYTVPNVPAAYKLSSGVSQLTRGLPTAKVTAVLNTPADQLWDVMYYDDLGRATKSYAEHYLGGTANTNNYDLTSTTYNFTNQPTSVTRQHWNTGSGTYAQLTAINTYLYDQVGRKVKSWEQLQYGNNTITPKTLLSQIDYNEIGQVLNKHLHSTDSINFYQNIAYTYNERGWLYTSTSPLFAMLLYYNTGGGRLQYNGNISVQYWGTPGSLSHNFSYIYDKLNRLTYGASNDAQVNKETGITYDLMGNLTALQRYQTGTVIDNLTYTYTGNQLQSIADASGSNTGLVNGTTNYTFDGNGNELTQANTTNTQQNKTFVYNLLNLPQTVTLPSSTLTYTYDAAGNKLRRKSTGLNTTTDYIAGIQYDGQTTPAFSFIQTEEGKAAYQTSTGGFDYMYYLGDNLGNTRVTFDTQSGNAVTLQKDDYYAFGMEINSQTTSPKNEYLYNKKELQEEQQQYDYGARFYDPVIARWTTVDPLAEKSRRWSPYNYVMDSPIRFIDPDGMMRNLTLDQAEATSKVYGQMATDAAYATGAEDSRNAVNDALDRMGHSNEAITATPWASKLGHHVHQTANANGINRSGEATNEKEKKLRALEIKALNDGTEWADADEHQTGKYSYMHAMTNGFNKQLDIDMANQHVREYYEKALESMRLGNIYDAYRYLGIAIHPLQDATSPAHAGFQKWTGNESKWQEWQHAKQELNYPGRLSNLQMITNYYINSFQHSMPLPSGNLFQGITADHPN